MRSSREFMKTCCCAPPSSSIFSPARVFVAALLATPAGLVEPLIIVSGLAGFGGWLLVRRHARRHADDPASQPVVLRALISGRPIRLESFSSLEHHGAVVDAYLKRCMAAMVALLT